MDVEPSGLSKGVATIPSRTRTRVGLVYTTLSGKAIRGMPFARRIYYALSTLGRLNSRCSFINSDVIFENFVPGPGPAFYYNRSAGILMCFVYLYYTYEISVGTAFAKDSGLPQRLVSTVTSILGRRKIAYSCGNRLPFAIGNDLNSNRFAIPTGCTSRVMSKLLMTLGEGGASDFVTILNSSCSGSSVRLAISVLQRDGVVSTYTSSVCVIHNSRGCHLCSACVNNSFSLTSGFMITGFVGSGIQMSNLSTVSTRSRGIVFSVLHEVRSSNGGSFSLSYSRLSGLIPVLTICTYSLGKVSCLGGIGNGKIKRAMGIRLVYRVVGSINKDTGTLSNKVRVINLGRLGNKIVSYYFRREMICTTTVLSALYASAMVVGGTRYIAGPCTSFFSSFEEMNNGTRVVMGWRSGCNGFQ